jgi:hypothetical protein
MLPLPRLFKDVTKYCSSEGKALFILNCNHHQAFAALPAYVVVLELWHVVSVSCSLCVCPEAFSFA